MALPLPDDTLAMFGELEDAPDDRLVVRACGYVLGTAAGWFHLNGFAVGFPEFRTEHTKLLPLMKDIRPTRVCLGIDFYTGEVKMIEVARDNRPKVHHSLHLNDLIGPTHSLVRPGIRRGQ